MQPPPRKVKETQEVKVAFSEQVARLQSKHQQESELLEDIRSYSKQRAAIEKEYGQALQRLAQQFQKKDWHKGKGDVLNSGSVFAVWRSLVEATAHGGASRLGAAEGYRSLTAEALKSLRTASEQRAKRGLERLQQVQGELVDAVRELNKVKKKYCQLGHIASVAREKASDSQARSKKSDHGIFHFRTGLHKVTAKLNARLGECDQRLMEVRNEYLLMLVATNSHHQHYLCTELPAIMKSMDGDLYDQVREQLTLLCHTEIGASQSTQSELARICEDCGQVTREQDLVLFLQESTAFTRTSEFHFQKVPGDTVSGLQHSRTSPEGESCLDKEARKWATKAAKDYKIISHGERALHTLERRRKLLMEDAGSGVELKMEEVKESIRKAQVSRVKAESRLALLASAGVDVDPWVSSAMGQADEELERERRLSEARLSNGDVSSLEDEFEFEDFDENVDIFTESTSGPGVCGYPMPCRVLYSYQGCQADELSITEGEELQVIEDGDMEDWLKARNAAGQVGYVPERYLQFLRPPAEGSAAHEVGGSPRLDSSLNSSESSPGCPTRGQQRASHTVGLARALYQYCGQSAEELSFQEGALIRLLRCGHSDVDDGFWEGELDGRVGVFPSLVVELVGEGEEEEEEEEDEDECFSSPTPPPFSPPVPIAGAPPPQEHGSSSCPGSWSARGSSPRDLEDRLLGPPQDLHRLLDSRGDSCSSVHSSPELSSRRIRPVRAPPLPPSHRNSPVP
ncbi:F-BAR and double SH3 domains protein 1-like isoform X3 [Anguilla rostrata]|uniref:F-BAR and double SH3 domains protein 1-like isoform X3 n=1 Tax=Anguilla rostrata TaxID=7938 RepID=UPI0030D0DF76